MKKKYKFTGDVKELGDATLHRIVAARSFGGVKAGDVGGWIESEDNLSHSGKAWVADDARACGDAIVSGNALVCGKAEIFGDARIFGNAFIGDNAMVCGSANVSEDAKVYGDALVCDGVRISRNARVFGGATLRGKATVSTGALISGPSDYVTVGPIGEREGFATFYRDLSDGIRVVCGDFAGTLFEFAQYADDTYGNRRPGRALRAAATLACARIGV